MPNRRLESLVSILLIVVSMILASAWFKTIPQQPLTALQETIVAVRQGGVTPIPTSTPPESDELPPQLPPGEELVAIGGKVWVYTRPTATPAPTAIKELLLPLSPSSKLSSKWPQAVLQHAALIEEFAAKHGFDPNLIAGIIWQESGGNIEPGRTVQTINGQIIRSSSSGAIGLMQVMPRDGISAKFKCKNGPCFGSRPSAKELLDKRTNVSTGTDLLHEYTDNMGSVFKGLIQYGPMDMGDAYAKLVTGHCHTYAPGSPCEQQYPR